MKSRSNKINAASEKRDKAIVKLLESGETYQRTAEIAGCSISKVQYIAKQHGLMRRNAEKEKAE